MAEQPDVQRMIADKVGVLLAKDFARMVIEKHQNNVYIEETDKHKLIVASKN
jgi:hypothetical protein